MLRHPESDPRRFDDARIEWGRRVVVREPEALDQPRRWDLPVLPHVVRCEIVAAVRFHDRRAERHAIVRLVGVIGGASSGKSTVFNNLIGGRHASRVTVLSHTTKGLVLAVPAPLEGLAVEWLDHERLLMPDLPRAR